ncbi:MAG: DUF3397 domain-containing protein [Lysinibacillus sp.]|nr:DUF3397 domain-containing protein [Lysinibacillus sp.]
MKIILGYLLSTLIFMPIVVLLISYIIFRKVLKKKGNSFGLAADITTFVLFFSVSISLSTLWGATISIIAIVISIFIAMLITYIDWKTKKEIEVLPLLRKIWRIQFMYLFFLYTIVWIIGIIQSIIIFTT